VTTAYRLNRLLAADGRCVNVAIDHGLFNERAFLDGIEDMPRVVSMLADASPDAIQLTPGLAPLLQSKPGRKPSLVLRTDAANVYGTALPHRLFTVALDDVVERAVRLDAACVVVNLLSIPDQPELHERCVENIAVLRSDCERFGMPLMIEPLVMRPDPARGGYAVDGDLDRIMTLVRQAVELGADVVKADPCDDPHEYGRVISVAAGRPILVRGGGRVSDMEILNRTHALVRCGAAGVVYGRNVVQHENPSGMIRGLMAIVHAGATPDEAARLLATDARPDARN
jgi:DhnA family fructose-bisphosphate aldolase class Ia